MLYKPADDIQVMLNKPANAVYTRYMHTIGIDASPIYQPPPGIEYTQNVHMQVVQ